MTHENEYHDNMITMLELIWGEGYMAPGGAGNVAKMLRDIETRGKRILDIGCGIGGPALEIARTFELIRGELYPRMVELLGQESADHFVENWRAMVVVCDKGEMRQGYCRGRRPD